MADESTAIVKRDTSGGELARADDFLMPAVPMRQMIDRYNAIVEFAQTLMKKGTDYGVIPGTDRKNENGTPSNKNNTLLKPGAEKLCTLFGLVAEYEDYRVVEDWEHGFFNYGFRCLLKRGDRVVGTGIGSANSREKKYRRTSKLCPECNQPTIKRSKKRDDDYGEPGWYCWSKIGGCGAQFPADEPALARQAETVNPDEACDLVNTILKMGQKRAFVAAVLQATNASEFFTQDLEDLETIDATWEPTPPAAPKGPPPAANPDGSPNLANDETFIAEAKAAALARNITPAEFDAGLAATLKTMKTTLPALPLTARQAILAGIQSGRSDKWKTAAPTSPPAATPAPTADDLETQIAALSPDAFRAKLREIAIGHQVPRQDFDPGVQRFVTARLGTGKKLDDLSTADRMELLEAVQAGVLDWSTGQVPQTA